VLGSFISVVLAGFGVGALARWAVPGPDPMPAWLTIFIGLTGSLVGGGVTIAVTGFESRGAVFAVLLVSIAVAAGLVIGYRRFVQKRPITGPGAQKLPTRGFGIERLRQRLRRLGVDPETLAPASPDPRQESLRKLRELRAEGLLTDEEYEAKKAQLEQG